MRLEIAARNFGKPSGLDALFAQPTDLNPLPTDLKAGRPIALILPYHLGNEGVVEELLDDGTVVVSFGNRSADFRIRELAVI